jgi:hypothetical protein
MRLSFIKVVNTLFTQTSSVSKYFEPMTLIARFESEGSESFNPNGNASCYRHTSLCSLYF